MKRVSSDVDTHLGGMLKIGKGAINPTQVKRVSSHAETHFGGMLQIGSGKKGERTDDGNGGTNRGWMRRAFPKHSGFKGAITIIVRVQAIRLNLVI